LAERTDPATPGTGMGHTDPVSPGVGAEHTDPVSPGVGVELEVMVTAQIAMPDAYVYRPQGSRLTNLPAVLRPGSQVVRSPCLAYAIRHPSAGTILIDTGMHPDASRSLRRDFGGPMSLMFRGLRPEPFDEQLRALDIEPGDVERVVMTHLHVDHTSGMRLLPRAEFTCSRAEWAAAGSSVAVAKGYVRRHLPAAERMRLLDVAEEGEPYATFAHTIDLLGDGSIRLISTPGHTAGHLSMLLRLTHGHQVLAIGDAAYTLRSVREQVLPMVTDDDDAAMRSLREIAAFAEREPRAILVPTHDPSAWHELRHVSASAQRALTAAGLDLSE
jgi:N-acyl homoserine lactone hydrolase